MLLSQISMAMNIYIYIYIYIIYIYIQIHYLTYIYIYIYRTIGSLHAIEGICNIIFHACFKLNKEEEKKVERDARY
jgi:hypothetical protein